MDHQADRVEPSRAVERFWSRLQAGHNPPRPTQREQLAKMTPHFATVLAQAEAEGLPATPADVHTAATNLIALSSKCDRAETVRPRAASRARESHRGRSGHRRSSTTRAGPSDDDGPGEPPPAARWLTIAPKREIYTFGALTLDRDLWREVNR
jgi:hypothetical protein